MHPFSDVVQLPRRLAIRVCSTMPLRFTTTPSTGLAWRLEVEVLPLDALVTWSTNLLVAIRRLELSSRTLVTLLLALVGRGWCTPLLVWRLLRLSGPRPLWPRLDPLPCLPWFVCICCFVLGIYQPYRMCGNMRTTWTTRMFVPTTSPPSWTTWSTGSLSRLSCPSKQGAINEWNRIIHDFILSRCMINFVFLTKFLWFKLQSFLGCSYVSFHFRSLLLYTCSSRTVERNLSMWGV